MSTTSIPEEPKVLFESDGSLRKYTLNRPLKLNALDEPMLSLLRPKIEEWSASNLCGTIVGVGVGRAFCVGGDVESVIANAADPATRPRAIDFFKREFEMDYILAALQKPYVTILDGITMGGGVGLAALAPFRIATENTVFAMPETNIGYCPDVGGSFFLSRLDGQLGTYLALTSDNLRGRAVFELGFATHFIPSRRIPTLLDRLAALDSPTASHINNAIEELSSERMPEEPASPFLGATREAMDFAFRHDSVEKIVLDLESFIDHEDASVKQWATKTLAMLHARSPTSLKVALKAIRFGKSMGLLEALNMEMKIATAFCNQASPDFTIGVTAVLIRKDKARPQWSPATLPEVSEEIVSRFFDEKSPYLASAPVLTIPETLALGKPSDPAKYALPTEADIRLVVNRSKDTGTTKIRLDELIERVDSSRAGKLGVREKVLEVAQRKCIVEDNADGNRVWLTWKEHPSRP